MATYEMIWITDQLATGHAPMSFGDLDCIRKAGVDAIINLCGEFCDLKKIEEQSGFEVYYLPIPDECTPDLDALEQALAWLDEALCRNKKILVHCRFGVGRSNIFVFAHFLRQGLDLQGAGEKLGLYRADSLSYSQWRFLKEYSNQMTR